MGTTFGSRRWEMSVAKLVRSAARKALSLGLVTLLASAAWAQDAPPPQTTQNAPPQNTQPSMPPLTPMPQAPAPQHNAHLYSEQNYAKPHSGFPNIIAPYTSRHVPPPNLTNSAMTDKLFHDGNIYLSINDAVAMALENNLDITLQRYNLSIADTDLLLTSSGTRTRRNPAWCRARQAGHLARSPPEARAAPPPAPPAQARAARRLAWAAPAPARWASSPPPWVPDRRSTTSIPS